MDIYFKEEYAKLYKEIEKGEVENFSQNNDISLSVFLSLQF